MSNCGKKLVLRKQPPGELLRGAHAVRARVCRIKALSSTSQGSDIGVFVVGLGRSRVPCHGVPARLSARSHRSAFVRGPVRRVALQIACVLAVMWEVHGGVALCWRDWSSLWCLVCVVLWCVVWCDVLVPTAPSSALRSSSTILLKVGKSCCFPLSYVLNSQAVTGGFWEWLFATESSLGAWMYVFLCLCVQVAC